MHSRLLITTADERTWPKDKSEPVLFLGEWCKRFSRKHIWEHMDYEVADYHWDDRNKLFDDYQYLQNLYEELLLDLSDKLNRIHFTNHGKRYWRILLGPWLGYFVQMLYDRWYMLSYVFDNYNISKCNVLDRGNSYIVPNDMENFISLFLKDDWNEAIYSQLIDQYWNDHIEIIKIPLHCDDSIKNTSSVKNIGFRELIKGPLKKIIQIYNRIFQNNSDVFFISSYLPLKSEIKLQLKLKQIPKIRFSQKIAPLEIDLNVRRWRLSKKQNDKDIFSTCVRNFISQHIPMNYLEGFKSLTSSVKNSTWPNKPRLIFTSNAYSSDDTFKCWAAEMTENMVPLVIAQHGGHFGINMFSFNEEHQIKIADKWLSWGWTDDTRPQVITFGNIKTVASHVDYDPDGGALMVEGVWPRYSYHLFAVPIASQWIDYFDDQKLFINKLSISLRNKIIIRLYKDDYGWDQKDRWVNDVSEVEIDDGFKDIKELVSKSRIYISTYNATTYLESLNWNVPTIIFWNTNHWEVNEDAKPYFKQLKSVGIFHENPESAAEHMMKVWDDVDVWWKSDHVQTVRKIFCERYSRQLDNPVNKLKTILQSVESNKFNIG